MGHMPELKLEQRVRQEKIDLQLGRAGWTIGSRRLIEEYIVEAKSLLNEPKGEHGFQNGPIMEDETE
jgi:hypothetical protein